MDSELKVLSNKQEVQESKKEGQELKKYLNEKNISVDEAVNTIGRLSKNKLYSLLNQDEIPHEYVQLFHYLLRVPLSVFGKKNKEKILSPYANNTEVFFVCHPKKDDNYMRSLREYHENITYKAVEFLKSEDVKKLFIVGYYPLKSYGESDGDSIALEIFRENQRRYFKEIQKTIINIDEDFRYSRCEQLALSPDKKITGRTNLAKYCIEYLADETFEHILWSFKHLGNRFTFYAISQVYRRYAFWIADDKSMITEYHRYNKHGAMVPDIHLAFSENEPPKEIKPSLGIQSFIECHQSHTAHLEKHKERFCIEKEHLISAFIALEKDLEQKKDTLSYPKEEELNSLLKILNYAEKSGLSPKEKEDFDFDNIKLQLLKRQWEITSKKDALEDGFKQKRAVIRDRIAQLKNVFADEYEKRKQEIEEESY